MAYFSQLKKSSLLTTFSILSQDYNNENPQALTNNHHGNENLDSTIEKYGLNGAFPRTFTITTMERETIPSERCVIEKNSIIIQSK
ncbi:unnamed protein product [Rotaria sp. Silwood2]|nr:unnamed protein product [Rotaria sp. Silwood2]CAF2904492.1 unnamed protein product [Rotaria sp. Silwood2]CAF3329069.1 unnamed protein product [Rotaria sp. Silwood2]CAF4322889.1 unnamed protein product [Rotaria sp. Silwood2]CAF4428728.1 unnamed protein product [Rotaria sp. Silwood2]